MSGVASSVESVLSRYNPFLVYCRELAPGTVSLTGYRAQSDDSKHDSHYSNVSCPKTQCSEAGEAQTCKEFYH